MHHFTLSTVVLYCILNSQCAISPVDVAPRGIILNCSCAWRASRLLTDSAFNGMVIETMARHVIYLPVTRYIIHSVKDTEPLPCHY